MEILSLIQNSKKKNTNEYSSPCPKCGGDDRFIIFLDSQRFWCRQCNWKGDKIDLLMYLNPGMSFKQAQELSGQELINSLPGKQERKKMNPYRDNQLNPPVDWSKQAERLTAKCFQMLMQQNDGLFFRKKIQKDRGLSLSTIQKYGLGFNTKDLWINRFSWGLAGEKKMYIPAGLVIPIFDEVGNVIRLRIRKQPPFEGSKYHVVTGSKINWSCYGNLTNIIVLVESDLDAMLITQETGLCCFASTSAALRPDKSQFQILKQCDYLLDCLDSDRKALKMQIELKEALGSKYCRLPPIKAKDPNDMRIAGLTIKAWIDAGLDYHQINQKSNYK